MKTTVMVATAILLCLAGSAQAAEVDMKAIAQIESSNNPSAYNTRSKATGLYQITPICLADFHFYHDKRYTLEDMLDPDKCYEVAYWYFNDRIPRMLKYYGLKLTINNILIAYNAGINYLVTERELPSETTDYIRKYNEAVK